MARNVAAQFPPDLELQSKEIRTKKVHALNMHGVHQKNIVHLILLGGCITIFPLCFGKQGCSKSHSMSAATDCLKG